MLATNQIDDHPGSAAMTLALGTAFLAASIKDDQGAEVAPIIS